MLQRTLPSLSVLTNTGWPVLVPVTVNEVMMACRWPSSTSAGSATGLTALPLLQEALLGPATAAAGGAAVGPPASALLGTAATSTSPNRSAKNTCRPSSEKLQALAFLLAFLQWMLELTGAGQAGTPLSSISVSCWQLMCQMHHATGTPPACY